MTQGCDFVVSGINAPTRHTLIKNLIHTVMQNADWTFQK